MIIKAFIYWHVNECSEAGGEYICRERDDYGKTFPNEYFLRGEHEFEFSDKSDLDPRELMINYSQQKKARVIQEATVKAEQIEEKIQKLLALDAPA